MHTNHERWRPEDAHAPQAHDPIGEALAPLRSAEWKNTVHQSRLEHELRKDRAMDARKSWKSRAAAITGFFLAGGLAGATGIALVERFLVEETDLEGPETHIRVTDTETGEVIMDENIQDGDMLFHITESDDESAEDAVLLVRPIDEPVPEEGEVETIETEVAPDADAPRH